VSFLIDPPWLYANGRIAAELPAPAQKPLTAATLHFDHRNAGPRTHAASALLFATYPVWMWLGLRHGTRS
jgi:hypothetical protein